jgi:hypothetical protein
MNAPVVKYSPEGAVLDTCTHMHNVSFKEKFQDQNGINCLKTISNGKNAIILLRLERHTAGKGKKFNINFQD